MSIIPRLTEGYTDIPISAILDQSLSSPALLLYSRMLISTQDQASLAYTNSQLSELMGWTDRGTRNLTAELMQKGLIVKQAAMTAENAKNLLCCHKKPSSLNLPYGIPFFNCQWCSSQTVILHEHHWPVQKSDSGTETVSICAGCHAEYHFLCRESYRAAVLSQEGGEA